MDCHRCGVCCTEISISSPIPLYHVNGKPAGVKCAWLGNDNLCELFGTYFRPDVCSSFKADVEVCGTSGAEAVKLIKFLELATSPVKGLQP